MKKEIAKDVIFTLLGTLILAVSINVFLAPNKISGGGVSGIGTVLLHLFNIPISASNFAINAVLFIFGYKMLGKYSVVKTVLGIVGLTVFLEVANLIPAYTEDIIVATLAGGILMGFGVGLVIRRGASTGGSDFFALMAKRKFPHISAAMLIMVTDCIIIIVSGIIFKSINIMVYSIAALFISTKITEYIESVGDNAKTMYIMSKRETEIADMIMTKFERGVTGFDSVGMYKNYHGKTLMSVVAPKELPIVIREIKEIDPVAFIVINDAREVFGEGFKEEV